MIPKKVLDLFPMWEYQCQKCEAVYDEPKHVCVKCGTPINQLKDRRPPKFLKTPKTMSDYAHNILAPKLSPTQRKLLFKYFTEIFNSGFETETNDFNVEWTGKAGSPIIVEDPVYSGNKAAQSDTQYNYWYKTLSEQTDVYLRFYFQVSDVAYLNHVLVYAGATIIGTFQIMADGDVRYIYKDGTGAAYYPAYGGYAAGVEADIWYCMEIHHSISATGKIQMWIDEASCGNEHTADTNDYGNIDKILMGRHYGVGTCTITFDSVIIADTYIGPEVTPPSPPSPPGPVPAGTGTVNVYAVADSEEVIAFVQVVETGKLYDTPFSTYLEEGQYTIRATYKGQTLTWTPTVQAGQTHEHTFRFTKMHTLTIVSDPSPIDFTLDGEAFKTPFTIEKPSGDYEIVFPPSWHIGVDKYLFTQWENGSVEPKRTATLGSPNQTLTATYTIKQVEGAAPASQRQIKDAIRQVVGKEGDISEDNPLPTEDSGVHSNPEKYIHDNAWEAEEVTINAVGVGGEQALGVAVVARKKRRITELTIRHAGTNNTVVTLLIQGGNTKVTLDVTAQATREWESDKGRIFDAAEISAVQSSDVTGGNTFISASGVEA